jgi:hypothetical protein
MWKLFPDINKLCDVASCWIYEYIGILLGARPILHISRIKVKTSANTMCELSDNARTFALPCPPRKDEATAVLMRQLLRQVDEACGLSLELQAFHIDTQSPGTDCTVTIFYLLRLMINSPYRTVNTFRIGYENRSVNVV